MEQMQPLGTLRVLPATLRKEKESHRLKHLSASSGSSPASGNTFRCTRSQAAPDWTTFETLVLVSEIAAMDEYWIKALSSYQKWKMISDNCVALDVIRSSNQCKWRWESLLAGYGKISDWGSRHGEGSYWKLSREKREQLGLPLVFDQEVFGVIDAVIKPQDWQTAAMADGNSENLTEAPRSLQDVLVTPEVEMLDVNDTRGSEENVEDETQAEQKARFLARTLQENAQEIHNILRGELDDNLRLDRAQVDFSNPSNAEIKFTRYQADQLIKALTRLVVPLNEFTELIRAGEYEGIRPI